MVNAQEWLDKNYPIEKRKNIRELDISSEELEGSLKIEEFSNLEKVELTAEFITNLVKDVPILELINLPKLTEVNCRGISAQKIIVTNCPLISKLDCSKNEIEELDFSSFSHDKLTYLDISDNKFSEQGLSFVKKFANLETLSVANNKFTGSLEELGSLTKLKCLDVFGTDVDCDPKILSKYEEINYEKLDESNIDKYLKKFANEPSSMVKNLLEEDALTLKIFSYEEKKEDEIDELKLLVDEPNNIEISSEKGFKFSTWFNEDCATLITKKNRLLYLLPPRWRLYLFVRSLDREYKKIGVFAYNSKEEAREIEEKIRKGLNKDNPIFALFESGIDEIEISKIRENFVDIRILNNVEKGFKNHDIIRIKMDGLPKFDSYLTFLEKHFFYHAAIYLEENNKVAHISGDAKLFTGGEKDYVAKIESWEKFLREHKKTKKLQRINLLIPFKRSELIQRHIDLAVEAEYGKGEYDILGKNCEHFATLCVCGIKYSPQNIFVRRNTIKKSRLESGLEESNKFFANLEKNKNKQPQTYHIEIPPKGNN